MQDTFHYLFQTPFGKIVLLWTESETEPTLCRILLSNPRCGAERALEKAYPHSRFRRQQEMHALALRIVEFLEGGAVSFAMDRLWLDRCSVFQQEVLRVEHKVPRGRVTSYRRIAEKVGKPDSARAVGRALASNPFPIVVPCHRALRSDGSLGGFQGGLAMKRALLTFEGIAFAPNGKVLEPSFY